MENNYVTEGAAEYVVSLFPFSYLGVCVDIGAFDPLWISNSWLFEQMGWRTYCIEPNPHCIPRLKKYRKNVLEYACSDFNDDNVPFYMFKSDNLDINAEAAGTGLIDHRLGEEPIKHMTLYSDTTNVKVRTLDWLMENEIKEDHIDYLSIDVERNEMATMMGISFDIWKPKVICIENIDQEDTAQFDYLTLRDYRKVHRVVFNDFYVREDYYKQRFR